MAEQYARMVNSFEGIASSRNQKKGPNRETSFSCSVTDGEYGVCDVGVFGEFILVGDAE